MNIYPQHYSFSEKLDFELAKRSRRSAILYLAVALACCFVFFRFNTTLDLVVATVFIFVIIITSIRWVIAHQICISSVYEPKKNRLHKLVIALVIPVFSAGVSLIFYQAHTRGIEGIFAILLAAAFAVGSIISLSPARYLGFALPSFLLIPMAAISFYFADSTDLSTNLSIPLFILLCLVYCFIQSNDTRRDLFASIQFETSLLESNEELRQSQRRLEEETAKATHSSRLAALGEMAGGIAHEINNPLMIIKSHASIIQKALVSGEEPPNPKILIDRLEKIVSAVQRVANIVRGLRSFAQQGDLLPLEQVSLAEILNDTLDFCQEKLTQHSVQIFTESLEQSNVFVSCRSVQISQVFLNLINNSFDAIKNLSERWIRISVETRDGHVFIYFQDSGSGISPSLQNKIFLPFYTTKETGEGTGLGLSISRGILKAHHGDIQYLSTEKNTTFMVQLPLATHIDNQLV